MSNEYKKKKLSAIERLNQLGRRRTVHTPVTDKTSHLSE